MSVAENKAVFLSYASQDAEAVARIAEALRASGVEVWFDQDELVGGDAWDKKIRQQIKECALFVPVISTATQARTEGYFRLEWRLADQRTHLMAKGRPFLLPVVIDGTRDAEAHVPDSFAEVQWTRLPGGETPEKFCERVKKLLGGSIVGGALRPDERTSPAESGHKAPPTANRRAAWLVPAMIGATAVIALALWQPWRAKEKPNPTPAPSSAPTATVAAAPLTEAQQLVAKARKILDEGDEMNRENYSLAEVLVERAVALDPAEPLAWALYSRISFLMSWHSFDVSETRRESMRRQAERAHALAPELTEVQLAWADARIYVRQDLAAVERELLALAAREPKDWRVQRSLGRVYSKLSRFDDAIASHRRELELSGGSPSAASDLINMLIRSHRFAEAEAIKVSALATHATGRLRTHDVFIRTQWRGDLAGAQMALNAWPDWLLLEDRGAIMAWRTALWAKQYDKALAVALRMSRDYLRDTFFRGPRAVLTARAHEGAGHVEAARDDWRMVVQLTERELAKSPTDAAAAYWKAWALARLGDSTQAQALALQMQQRNLLSYRASAQNPVGAVTYFQVPSAAPLWATVGRADLALAELSGPAVVNDSPAITRAMLELDPAFDALRTEPGFRDVLAAAPAPSPLASNLSPASATADAKSLAVLAFRNLSDAQSGDYFSDGLSEELGNVLGRVPGLRVAGSTSAFSFKGKAVTLPDIARQLGVAYLVEGSVQREGSDVRITAKLINGADGLQVWTSGNLKRKVESSLALQEEIAGLIAKELSLKLGVASAAPVNASVNPQAFELYVQARQVWNLRTTTGFEQAEQLLQRALVLEPNFARAHAALADVWTLRFFRTRDASGTESKVDSAEGVRIRDKIAQALALDPGSAEAHASLGIVLYRDGKNAEAESSLRRAVALNPNYASAQQWLGQVLLNEAQIDQALTHNKLATELDPLSPITWAAYGFGLHHAGRSAAAIAACDRALLLRPNFEAALRVKCNALVELARFPEAVALAAQLPGANALNADIRLFVLARARHKTEATALLAELTAQASVSNDRLRSFIALDRIDETWALLSQTGINLYRAVDYLLDPVFDPFRNDSRWVKLMANAGLTAAHARAQAWRAAHPPEKAAGK